MSSISDSGVFDSVERIHRERMPMIEDEDKAKARAWWETMGEDWAGFCMLASGMRGPTATERAAWNEKQLQSLARFRREAREEIVEKIAQAMERESKERLSRIGSIDDERRAYAMSECLDRWAFHIRREYGY